MQGAGQLQSMKTDRFVRIIKASVNDGNGNVFASNTSSVELIDACPLVHRVIVILGVWSGLYLLYSRCHWNSFHWPNIGHAVDCTESVDIVNFSFDNHPIEKVAAVELPEVGAIHR